MHTFRWAQGEHVAAIAPTGAGKTTLIRELLPLRRYTVFFGTKPDDPLYRKLIQQGYRRVESMTELKPWDEKIMLWPKPRPTIRETMIVQRNAFLNALDIITRHGSWTVIIDEAKYLSEILKLKTELTYSVEQLRSIGATVVLGSQRPAWLPVSALSNATHVFLWKSTNRDDAMKLADMGGIDANLVRTEARTLGRHEFLYINTRGTDSKILRTQVGK